VQGALVAVEVASHRLLVVEVRGPDADRPECLPRQGHRPAEDRSRHGHGQAGVSVGLGPRLPPPASSIGSEAEAEIAEMEVGMADVGGEPDFTIVLTGYDRAQVDAYLAELRSGQRRDEPVPRFDRALRGYEVTQVDAYVSDLMAEPVGGRPAASSPSPPPSRPEFSIVLRGYARDQVDRFVTEALARITELERTVERLSSQADAGRDG
jgi:hypothetical protein